VSGLNTITEGMGKLNLSVSDVVLGYQQLAQMARSAAEFMGEAAAEQGIRQEFQRMAQAAGLSSREVMAAMENVAQGTISAQRQMAGANRLFLANMDVTADQIGQLMAIARDRARGMGMSVDAAYNDIITGVTRSSPMILDNLGLIVKQGEANEILAQALGKSVDDLTAQERATALLNQVLRDNGDAMDRVLGGQETMVDRVATLTTNWEEFTSALKAWTAESDLVEGAMGGINTAMTAANQLTIMTLSGLEGMGEYARILLETGDAALAMEASTRRSNEAMIDMLEAQGQFSRNENDLSDDLVQVANDFATGRTEISEFGAAWNNLMSRLENDDAQRGLLNAVYMLEGGEIDAGRFVTVVESIVNSFDGLTDSAYAAAQAELAATEAAAAASDILSSKVLSNNEDAKESLRERREAQEELAESWLNVNERIVNLEQDLQNSLDRIATQGANKRADILTNYGDRVSDISTKYGDKAQDLDIEIAGARLSTWRDYWQEIARINEDGSEDEEDAIRRRDAYALTKARNQTQKEKNRATQAHNNELEDMVRANNNKRAAMMRAQQREQRDANTHRLRQLRDQQTAEQRSILAQETANQLRITREREGYRKSEAEHMDHWKRMAAQAEAGSKAVARASSKSTTSVGQWNSGINYVRNTAGKIVSGGRGRIFK